MTTPPPTPRNGLTNLTRVLTPVIAIVCLAAGGLYLVKSHLPTAPAGATSDAGAGQDGLKIGSIIPDFELKGIDGKATKFSNLKAKVVLMNFWATWCEACMVEMPSIVQLRGAYKDKGFEVVGINLDENPEAVLPKAEKELGITFPVFNDPENKITDFFDVHAIPLSIFLGPGRKILYVENGERNWNDQDVHRQLEQWLQ